MSICLPVCSQARNTTINALLLAVQEIPPPYGVSVGSLLSFSLPHNVHVFAEYKVGKGNIRNRDPELGLKDSGDEKVTAYGGGISWTASNKALMVVLRAQEQTGRHIDTSFGDLSVIKFF